MEEVQIVDIILKSLSDIEFDVQKYRNEIPHGWEIEPRRLPLKVPHTTYNYFRGKYLVLEPLIYSMSYEVIMSFMLA